jgi:hypothetical protein
VAHTPTHTWHTMHVDNRRGPSWGKARCTEARRRDMDSRLGATETRHSGGRGPARRDELADHGLGTGSRGTKWRGRGQWVQWRRERADRPPGRHLSPGGWRGPWGKRPDATADPTPDNESGSDRVGRIQTDVDGGSETSHPPGGFRTRGRKDREGGPAGGARLKALCRRPHCPQQQSCAKAKPKPHSRNLCEGGIGGSSSTVLQTAP